MTDRRVHYLRLCRRLCALGAGVCSLLLFITGFSPVLTGGRMTGYALILHVTCAPVFVLCVAFLALSWSRQHVFGAAEGLLALAAKVSFWLLLLVMVPLTLSSVVSMFPWLGTRAQEMLSNLHRTSAMIFSVLLIIFMGVRSKKTCKRT